MIRYTLRCADGHDFESWFQSADAFDTLASKRLVTCGTCGSAEVSKALMAPRVAAKGRGPTDTVPAVPDEPQTEVEAKIAALRAKVEAEATYVGENFAREARAIHQSDDPDRQIYGEANLSEAKSLIDDGIAIAPLPFLPKAKAN